MTHATTSVGPLFTGKRRHPVPSPRVSGEREKRRPLAGVLLFASAVAMSGAGCGEDFAPYNRVEGLRVLAISSEPATPAPGEEARLGVLVHAPAGQAVSYAWSWCPAPGSASASYPCLVTEEQIALLLGAAPGATAPSFVLGAAETAALKIDLPVQALRALCAGAGAEAMLGFRPDCTGGFPVQVKVVVKAGHEEVTAVRTVRLRLEDRDANHNPTITAVAAEVDGTLVPIDGAAAVTVPRGEKVRIIADVPVPVTAEPHASADDTGKLTVEPERFFLTWFVEGGETDDERTLFIAGMVDVDRILSTKWKIPRLKDYPGEAAKLYVVIRDSRGGVGWWSGAVRLGGAP